MKRFLAISLLIPILFPVYSAETIINGTAFGKEGGLIRLLTYSDQISYKKITLDSYRISNDGAFHLSVDIKEITYAMIDLDFQQGDIFLVPGASYQLQVIYEEDAEKHAYYDRPPLEIQILSGDGEQVNQRIGNINAVYNEFLLKNPLLLQTNSKAAKVDAILKEMQVQVSQSSDQYLKDYVRYKSASLEMFARTKSREKLADDYLSQDPVLYGNVEYMDFFHLFFEKYLLTNNTYMPYSKTSAMVNGSATREEIVNELTKDPVISDAKMAELVLLSGLKEMSKASGFKLERIIFLLDDISSQSQYRENQHIASNLKERILWMRPGYSAPDFELPDVLGGNHQLAEYQGQYFYLSIISLYSPSSLTEMNLLADIYPDFKGKINFASIIMDELQPGWSKVVSDYRMDWDLLLTGDEIDLIEAYGATAPPVFILIDPKGKIFRYPAPSPSEELREVLDAF